MNSKISLTDLTDQLAENAKITKKEASAFLKLLFELIEENLIQDKIVKIKSLGTFKLIWVESRRIANVNTGEIQEIPGHYKPTFTPDADLSDAVNEPFAHLETIVLDDEIIADEPINPEQTFITGQENPLSEEEEEEEEEIDNVENIEIEQSSNKDVQESLPPEASSVSNIDSDPVIPDYTDETKEDVVEEVNKEYNKNLKEETNSFIVSPKPIFTVMKDEYEKPLPDDDEIGDSDDDEEDPEGFKIVRRWIISILVLAILAFAAYYLYNNYQGTHKIKLTEAVPTYEELAKQDSLEKLQALQKAMDTTTNKPVQKESKAVVSTTASQPVAPVPIAKPVSPQASPAKTVIAEKKETSTPKEVTKEAAKKEAIKATTKEREKEAVKPEKEKPTTYKSGKNIAREVMRPGSRLTLLAKKYYGNKAFWVYIYQANKSKIANPDNVPAGTEIVIPAKETYQIDPDNQESIDKAKKIASSILK